jgi:hypothetical protein
MQPNTAVDIQEQYGRVNIAFSRQATIYEKVSPWEIGAVFKEHLFTAKAERTH